MPVTARGRILVGVARRDVAGDLRAFLEVAADRVVGGGRAGAVGLLEAAVAAVEARGETLAPLAARRFGIEQRLHLVTPDLPLARATQVAQVMQRAEDFRQPLQIALIGRASALRRLRVGGADGEREEEDCEQARHAGGYARRLRAGQGVDGPHPEEPSGARPPCVACAWAALTESARKKTANRRGMRVDMPAACGQGKVLTALRSEEHTS